MTKKKKCKSVDDAFLPILSHAGCYNNAAYSDGDNDWACNQSKYVDKAKCEDKTYKFNIGTGYKLLCVLCPNKCKCLSTTDPATCQQWVAAGK